MRNTRGAICARRNGAEGEVGISGCRAIDEGQGESGGRRHFAVDTDIERSGCTALTGTAVATGTHVNNRFEADVDVVEEVFR